MNPEVITKFDVIKLYDSAMVEKFTFVVEDKTVPTVINTAQRPHASAQNRLGASKRNARVPLPSASLTRKTIPLDPKGGFARRRMKVGYTDSSKTRVKMAQPPQPISLIYDFNIVVATPNQINSVIEQYWDMFVQDKTFLVVNIPEWMDEYKPLVTTSHSVTDNTKVDALSGDKIFEMSSSLTLTCLKFRNIDVISCVGPRVEITFEEY